MRIPVLHYLFIVLLSVSCSKDASINNGPSLAMEQIKKYIDSGWNQQDLTIINTCFADTLTRRINNVTVASNRQELEANMNIYFKGFPDVQLEVRDLIANRGHVVLKWTISGTNTGEFGELSATGKKIKVSGISQFDLNEDGMIIFEDVFYNELSLLQQMGHTLSPPVLE